MAENNKVVIDKAHMKVDRSTSLGKDFESLQRMANAQADTPMGKFINQVAAYAEAATVISNILPEKEAKNAMDKLKDKFEKSAT